MTFTITTPTGLDDFTARTVADLSRLLEAANAADGHHAIQAPGHLYGSLSTALHDLLTYALGDAALAADVEGHLLDHYLPTPSTVQEVVQYVLDKRAADLAMDREAATFDALAATGCAAAGHPCGWSADADVLALADAARTVRDLIVGWGVAERGWSAEATFFGAPGHEDPRGWSLALEGDYEWPMLLPESIREQARAAGVHVEALTGWCVGMYPA
jgi:hypothetical protein